MHPTAHLSSEPSSRTQSRIGTPITSPRVSTSGQRPTLATNNSAMSTIMKKLNGATEEYWGSASPLYTPRGSVDNSRAVSRAPSFSAPTGTAAAPVAAAAAAASPKQEKKAGVVNKVKRALDRNASSYWGNNELNTYYAAGLKI